MPGQIGCKTFNISGRFFRLSHFWIIANPLDSHPLHSHSIYYLTPAMGALKAEHAATPANNKVVRSIFPEISETRQNMMNKGE
jgi:hypothetical protein